MFDMGFTELMLIGIVALVVIGPERLPGVARTAGKYVGRLKRFMTTVKADVEQELRADELRSILADQQKELDTLKDSISGAGKEFEKDINAVNEAAESLAQDVDASPEPDSNTEAATESSQESAVEPAPAPEPVVDEPDSKAKS